MGVKDSIGVRQRFQEMKMRASHLGTAKSPDIQLLLYPDLQSSSLGAGLRQLITCGLSIYCDLLPSERTYF